MDPKKAEAAKEKADEEAKKLLRRVRVVPASASYFSAKPEFTDDFIVLDALLRKYSTLPVVPPGHAPRVAWKAIHQYKSLVNEPIGPARYSKVIDILHRLNHIHPALIPTEVTEAMARFKRDVNPHDIKPRPSVIDEWGRSKGVGRRKTSAAVAWIVEGEGEVLVNGKTLAQKFGRLHDRESAIWALKSTQRLDKYNVFGLVKGGGVTGQAEAMALAVAKALLVQEPALKPALRRGKPSPLFYYSLHSPPWRIGFCDALRRGVGTLLRVHPLCRSTSAYARPEHDELFFTKANYIALNSWRRDSRSEKSREEEARPRQGAEDADVGQALRGGRPNVCTFSLCPVCIAARPMAGGVYCISTNAKSSWLFRPSLRNIVYAVPCDGACNRRSTASAAVETTLLVPMRWCANGTTFLASDVVRLRHVRLCLCFLPLSVMRIAPKTLLSLRAAVRQAPSSVTSPTFARRSPPAVK
jgi:ribosomal protein S9